MIAVAAARVEMPKLSGFGLALTSMSEVVVLRDGVVLESLSVSRLDIYGEDFPTLIGVAGVVGDVSVVNNRYLTREQALTFVESLGPIGGVTTICGNKDGQACE